MLDSMALRTLLAMLTIWVLSILAWVIIELPPGRIHRRVRLATLGRGNPVQCGVAGVTFSEAVEEAMRGLDPGLVGLVRQVGVAPGVLRTTR